MNKPRWMQFAVAALVSLVAGAANAQDGNAARIYITVDCMKSAAMDYEQLEQDVWRPMHQHLVDQGKRESWALYRVMYGDRSRCDYYTVTTYRGEEQLNADPGYGAAFEAAHPGKDITKVMTKTLAAREHVSSELWMLIDQTEILPHRFAVVNKMFAADPIAYETMESDVFKGGHEALLADGHRAGWAVYSLVSPIGTSIPYNYGTVDFVNDLSPVPMAEAMLAANPDRDLDAMVELLDLRDHVLSETWARVSATDAPAQE